MVDLPFGVPISPGWQRLGSAPERGAHPLSVNSPPRPWSEGGEEHGESMKRRSSYAALVVLPLTRLSAYYLTCSSVYDLMCGSVLGELSPTRLG
jgi:hypothetical protein